MYAKVKDKMEKPYDKYYWKGFADKAKENRLLLAVMEMRLTLTCSINTAVLNDRRMFRLNLHNKVLCLRSSVYSSELVYILPTANPKIRVFYLNAEPFKLMRIELFTFLNLVFNNVVADDNKHVNAMWVPQFCVTDGGRKMVKRITDFSITMKKSLFLAEEMFFCNHEYVRNGVLAMPRTGDVVFAGAVMVGLLHSDVERASTGLPIYAKMVDREEFF